MAVGKCPCGSKKSYVVCCEPLHKGGAAKTAEALMRSRYSAYVLELSDYLLESWHPNTRPNELALADNPNWKGLKVKQASEPISNTATVEFVARYHDGQVMQRLHEISRFERLDGHWYYLDGDIQT